VDHEVNHNRRLASSLSENVGDGSLSARTVSRNGTPTEENYLGASTSWVEFGEGTRAFLAVPQLGNTPFGAVILGHERYGLVQHTLDLAAKFARYGYVCVAPDMASHWDGDKAALNRGDVRFALSEEQVKYYYGQSLDFLLTEPRVNRKRIAAMGVCKSGGYPLLLNSVRSEVAANLMFYGGQTTKEEVISEVSAPILGVWGELDHSISIESMRKFRDHLDKHNKSYEFKVLAEAPHGWLNDTMPGRYRQPQAEVAWAIMIDFLNRVYAGGYPPNRVRQKYDLDIADDYDFNKNVRLE
jgi:carboxymethylenebutenolidase